MSSCDMQKKTSVFSSILVSFYYIVTVFWVILYMGVPELFNFFPRWDLVLLMPGHYLYKLFFSLLFHLPLFLVRKARSSHLSLRIGWAIWILTPFIFLRDMAHSGGYASLIGLNNGWFVDTLFLFVFVMSWFWYISVALFVLVKVKKRKL